jgi:hypothetical protein
VIRLKKMIRDIRGQSIVIFALALPVFFGLLALGIDLGLVTYNMVKMQDSADLAVISGVQNLPTNPVKAEQVTREVFINNYGTNEAIQNITVLNSFNSIKIEYESEVKLYFLPIIGKDTYKISGMAEAVIEPLVKPHTMVPIAISDDTPLVFDQEVVLFGELNDPKRGNFGLVDPTSDNSLNPNDYEALIANDYTGFKGMPSAGDEIWTRPGALGHRVKDGFLARLNSEDPYITCPVVDFSSVNGKSKVKILGYVRFQVTKVIDGNGRQVTIKGKFLEFLDTRGDGNGSAVDYGIKTIRIKH